MPSALEPGIRSSQFLALCTMPTPYSGPCRASGFLISSTGVSITLGCIFISLSGVYNPTQHPKALFSAWTGFPFSSRRNSALSSCSGWTLAATRPPNSLLGATALLALPTSSQMDGTRSMPLHQGLSHSFFFKHELQWRVGVMPSIWHRAGAQGACRV